MMKKNKIAFTLIEIIVAITITSMIMVSIVEIFIFSGTFSKKTNISRVMQENIKNFTEIIAEDVRNNGINLDNTGSLKDTLKTGSGTNETEYYLAKKNNFGWTKINITDYSECQNYKKEDERCVLIRKKDGGSPEKLINSWIAFDDLRFDISGADREIPKVTMYFTIRPAIKKGLSYEKIKNDRIIMQTTFSERLYKYGK